MTCPPIIGHDDPYSKPFIPIKSIPVEIIREVFIFSIPQRLDLCQPSVRTAPLQVSHVCSSWRRTALDTPQLWSSIAIGPTFSRSETETEVFKRHSDVIRQWFLRAGQRQALSLQYLGTELSPSADIVEVVLPYLGRLRELMIQLDDPLPLYKLFATGNLERLEILDFFASSDDDMTQMGEDRLSFWNAKRLRQLVASLSFTDEYLEDWRHFARWGQLTSLTLKFVDAQVWAPLLAECVNLQEGTFIVTVFDGDADLSPTVNAELKHLTYLDVSLDETLSIRVFDGFRFPSLTSLRIGELPESSWDSPEHFYEQIRSLRTLSYYGSPVVLIGLLRHAPSVLDLKFSTSATDLDMLFRPMQGQDGEEVLLPKLENLSLTLTDKLWPVQGLYDMLRSRTIGHTPSSVGPLKDLSILVEKGPEPRCECLRSLQVEGLPVLDLHLDCDCVLCCSDEDDYDSCSDENDCDSHSEEDDCDSCSDGE